MSFLLVEAITWPSYSFPYAQAWFIENIDWLLSGVGVTVVVTIISLFKRKPKPRLIIDVPRIFGSKSPGEPIRQGTGPTFVTEVVRNNVITWKYSLVIRNNSSVSAFNLSISYDGSKKFDFIGSINPQEPLEPLKQLELVAIFKKTIQSNAQEANEAATVFFPDELIGLTLILTYKNERGKKFKTIYTITDNKTFTKK